MYDFLVVGAGLFGCTFAHHAVRDGYRVLVIDSRPHVAGAAYDELVDGVPVCRYGQHVFHTNSSEVWSFVNTLVPFETYKLRALSKTSDRLFSFPINLMTLHQLWGVTTPQEAQEHLERVKVKTADIRNAEGWLLANVGEEITETFYRGYSEKQWHRPLAKIPTYIVRRLPLRTTWDDSFFSDRYEGMPQGGYTALCDAMLAGADVRTDCDYFKHPFRARHTVFTGPIDRYFSHTFGRLTYNTLRFEHTPATHATQGVAVINYPQASVPWLRSVEHGLFYRKKAATTVISRDFPAVCEEGMDPFYPIRDSENAAKYRQYMDHAKNLRNVTFGGRLGSYRYFNMDQTIMSAIQAYQTCIGERKRE